jgi:23S rRNA pseudouridine1911/1915/1917 synthase
MPERRTVTAPAARLDRYLGELVGQLSRNQVQRLIQSGAVLVNGRPGHPGDRLRRGDEVSWELPPPLPSVLTPEAIPLTVVYEDEDLLVVDKPAGLVVHPAPGHATGTLVHALLARAPNWSTIGGAERPGIVHRLDKETSGLLVVARTDPAHRALSRQLQDHTMHRGYRAIVVGVVSQAAGRIEAAIGRDSRHRQRMAVVGRGREAITEFHRLANSDRHSLLDVVLYTGRTHQVRVHLAYIRHPILGDRVYGKPSPLIDRPALHAARLTLRHPRTGKVLTFESPPPADFDQAWASVGGSTMP